MKNILLFAFAATLFAGCTQEIVGDDTQQRQPAGEVSFRAVLGDGDGAETTVGKATRATDGTWTQDDRVGIFVYNGKNCERTNAQYRIDNASTGEMNPAGASDKIYPLLGGGSLDYIAYYPYTATGLNGTIYPVDITDQSNPAAIDLLWAKADAQTDKVLLNFSHQLVKLNFTFNTSNYGVPKAEDLKVTLKNVNIRAKFNLETGTFFNAGTGDLPLSVTVSNGKITATALVIPMEDLTDCWLEFSSDDKNRYLKPWKASGSATHWLGGYVYSPSEIAVVRTQPKIGDFYYSDDTWSTKLDKSKTPIGIIWECWESPYSKYVYKGYIISLDESESVVWCNGWTCPVSGLIDNGVGDGYTTWSNMEIIAKYISDGNKSWDHFPGFKWVAQKNGHPDGGWNKGDRWYFARQPLDFLNHMSLDYLNQQLQQIKGATPIGKFYWLSYAKGGSYYARFYENGVVDVNNSRLITQKHPVRAVADIEY